MLGVLTLPQGPGCLAGGVYNFDDVTADGSLPNRFLGLSWQGLRVTNSQRFSACDGNNGFRYGVISGPNVAYSMEVGASGDMTNLVRITAPTPSSRISVLGFTATAAWQVRGRLGRQAQRVSTCGLRRLGGHKQQCRTVLTNESLRTVPSLVPVCRACVAARLSAALLCWHVGLLSSCVKTETTHTTPASDGI